MDAQSQEKLRRVLKLCRGVPNFVVPIDRRVELRVTGRGNHVTDKLVIRLVLVQAPLDPIMKAVSMNFAYIVSPFVAENCSPLVCEIVGIVGAVE